MLSPESPPASSFLESTVASGREFVSKNLNRVSLMVPTMPDFGFGRSHEGERDSNHPSWDSPTTLAINTIRAINSITADSPVNLARIRKVRSYVTLPTNRGVHIHKTHIPRREDIVLEHMTAEQATGEIKAEWVEYVVPSFFSPNSPRAEAEDNSETDPVVLYLHGGGYCLCSRKTHRGLTWKIAKFAQARVLAIDYRLSPEHVFPLALHDAISAYAFLTKTRPASRVIIAGDSAGGGLALALALWLRDNTHGLAQPAGVALMSPWVDLSHSMPSFHENGKFDLLREKVIDPSVITESRSHFYITDNSFITNPLVSPFFAQENPAKPMCPILIQVGDSERLRDESVMFAHTNFKSSPIQLEIYEGMVHVFQMLGRFIKVADIAMERLGRFAQDAVANAGNLEAGVYQRSVVWVDNDYRNDFPVRSMSEGEVDVLLNSSNGLVADEVAHARSSLSHEGMGHGEEDSSDVEFSEEIRVFAVAAGPISR
ncbi:hypothetical protein HDU98_005224 [Podochytrium sp. JEL0797]|nr:hypothetical protein HDU98_005224 [Podochytrium sp. JEL0797]